MHIRNDAKEIGPLTSREAAQRVGLTREQLLRRVERGEIAARFEGGRWLIDPASVEDYLARRAAQHQAPTNGHELDA